MVDTLIFQRYTRHIINTQKVFMRNLVIGFILGLVVATIGFSGLARMFDKGVDTVKTHSVELAK